MPAAGEAHRLAPGGPVERLGDGSPPVDHDRLALLVGDGQATDVELSSVGPAAVAVLDMAVDPPKTSAAVAEIEVGEPL